MKVSVLILTHNEEINIRRCLASLGGLDDVLVIDSGSKDDTVKFAREMGARTLTRHFDNFANQRNFGLEEGALRNEWVLHLDADEVLTQEFRVALDALVPAIELDGFRVPSKLILNGKWLRYAGMYPTYQVRLGHRDRLRFKQVGHGQREDVQPERIGTFQQAYLHYNFSHGVVEWFAKHIRYAQAEAHQLELDRREIGVPKGIYSSDATERRRALKMLLNHLPVWFRPPLRFFQVAVMRRGFLDGRVGVQYALMLSAYEAMIGVFNLHEQFSRVDGSPSNFNQSEEGSYNSPGVE